jgi:hypothetical protein
MPSLGFLMMILIRSRTPMAGSAWHAALMHDHFGEPRANCLNQFHDLAE